MGTISVKQQGALAAQLKGSDDHLGSMARLNKEHGLSLGYGSMDEEHLISSLSEHHSSDKVRKILDSLKDD